MTARLLVILVALCTLPANAAEKREEIVEYTLDFVPGNTLSVHANNGEIALKTWASDQVFVRAVKKVKAGSEENAEELLKTTTIDIAETDSGIEIRTQRPDNKWKPLRPDNKWVPFWNISVSYTITVPQSVRLNLETTNGSISIPPTTGDVKCKTSNGSIKMNGTRGSVNVQTVNGKINLTEIIGGVHAKTANGSIDIAIAEQVPDDIRAESINGGVKLFLPSDFQGHLQAKSTIGHIDTEFPIVTKGVKRSLGKSLSGDFNGGNGPRIHLQTVIGSIDIKQL